MDPRELTRQQLRELLLALNNAGFSETNLAAAWKQTTNQDMAASIIGYIRQAALGDPLVPFAQRVDGALQSMLCIVQTSREFSIKDVRLSKNNPGTVLPRYMFYWLQGPLFTQWLDLRLRGGNQKFASLGLLRESPVFLPPLPEQQEIVRRVEDLFTFADRIEVRLATAQKTVERLTPATLAKAFRGELVPQDSNDEPASDLLDRLRSQPATPPARTTRKKRA